VLRVVLADDVEDVEILLALEVEEEDEKLELPPELDV